MSEYVDFHYMPLEGRITGNQVLKQTEDAINDLGNKVYDIKIDEAEIQQAIEDSQHAVDVADEALATVTTNRAVWFNSVAEMKEASVETGITAATRGFAFSGDGGHAFYEIREQKAGDVYNDETLVLLDNDNVAECIDVNVPRSVDSIAELKAQNLLKGYEVSTKGYYSPNDGGAGVYTIRAKDVADVEDGGSIIFLDNGNVAELITDETVTPEKFGAKGNGTDDDTTALVNACKSGYDVFAQKTYGITISDHTLLTLNGVDGFKLVGGGKLKNLNATSPASDYQFIEFINCKNITFDIDYEGSSAYNISSSYGEACFRFRNCVNINGRMNVSKCRYGTVFGGYDNRTNYCKNIDIRGTGYDTGYFCALYGCEGIKINCITEKIHRSVYLAGCADFEVHDIYNDQYVADTNVIITNDYRLTDPNDDSTGVMFGCDNGIVYCAEATNATQSHTTESKNAGLSVATAGRDESGSELTTEIVFHNIHFDLDINSSSGGFGVAGTPASHPVTIDNVTVTLHTHGQSDFTILRSDGYDFNGYVTIKDSDIIPYGMILNKGQFILHNSKIKVANSTIQANLVLENNSYVYGRFIAALDSTCGFSYSGSISEAYIDGALYNMLSSSWTIDSYNTVHTDDIMLLSESAKIKLVNSNTAEITYVYGKIIKIPNGDYTAIVQNGKRTHVCVAHKA